MYIYIYIFIFGCNRTFIPQAKLTVNDLNLYYMSQCMIAQTG